MTNFLDRILEEKTSRENQTSPCQKRDLRNAILSHQDGIPK
jgi:hypothetical protein